MRIQQWFSDNSNFVQAFAAVIQTVIAIFMLWTLIQNAQVLKVTTRQLEATIDPVVTPHMFGATIQLTNDGSVDIKQITKTAEIAAWFDINLKKITDYQVIKMRQRLKDSLRQGQGFDIDLKNRLIPQSYFIASAKDPSAGVAIYSFVVTYRRAADMKSFVAFLPFLHSKNTKTPSTDIFIPLFPSFGSFDAGPANTDYSKFIEEARGELLTLYKDKVAQIAIE